MHRFRWHIHAVRLHGGNIHHTLTSRGVLTTTYGAHLDHSFLLAVGCGIESGTDAIAMMDIEALYDVGRSLDMKSPT